MPAEERQGLIHFLLDPSDEPKIYGEDFATKNRVINHLKELPVGINESLCVTHACHPMATVIGAYTPSLVVQEAKELFYTDLDNLMTKVPRKDKLNLIRDLKAGVGQKHILWTGTLGRE